MVAELRHMVVTPHVAPKSLHSAIDARTPGTPAKPRHSAATRRLQSLSDGPRSTMHGAAPASWIERVRFALTMAACNLARLLKLLAAYPR